ncbi:Bifunctional FolD [Gossypium australe]|uniref:Bifunctional FolD n=1 Tax=Gossypium australe TaxID=47621 RepID=A0A5B6UQ66_9ROSI|nr:Bifunctional FolD [Gossypium australe]
MARNLFNIYKALAWLYFMSPSYLNNQLGRWSRDTLVMSQNSMIKNDQMWPRDCMNMPRDMVFTVSRQKILLSRDKPISNLKYILSRFRSRDKNPFISRHLNIEAKGRKQRNYVSRFVSRHIIKFGNLSLNLNLNSVIDLV